MRPKAPSCMMARASLACLWQCVTICMESLMLSYLWCVLKMETCFLGLLWQYQLVQEIPLGWGQRKQIIMVGLLGPRVLYCQFSWAPIWFFWLFCSYQLSCQQKVQYILFLKKSIRRVVSVKLQLKMMLQMLDLL